MKKYNREKRQGKKSCTGETSIWRPKWFLITRSFAVIGVVTAIVISNILFRIETIHYRFLWILAFLLLFTNICYYIYYRLKLLHNMCDETELEIRLTRFTTVQINIDLIILTLMLHFAGGVTNPFILFYFFHTILASILLSKRAAYFEATVVVVLFSIMTVLEGMGLIRHYDLFSQNYYSVPMFILGMISAVTSTLFIIVYMTTSIMDLLRMQRLQLERSLEEQQRLEEEKSRFLDIVAHDLKAPLVAVETMVTSVLSVYRDSIDQNVRNMLERIPRRTGDLKHLIQNLLEFSKIQNINQIKTQFEPLNFLPIVAKTIDMYKSQVQDKNIKMTVHSDPQIPQIKGNKDFLGHLVANLVSNAIQYTPENNSITIKTSSESNWVVFTVVDTGIGIPHYAIPNIFNEFFRADNAKKMISSGTGLGLSIVKAIVKLHGGTINVHSNLGDGTAFTVRLPVLNRHTISHRDSST